MSENQYFEKEREKYRPKDIKLLIIAEAPPRIESGRFFYFLDIEGKPPEQLEWDMKLWWPMTEAIYATLLTYNLQKDELYAKWFRLINNWAFSHFGDIQNGEWYGYLHRDGTISNTLKGNMWKGPFHLPRALIMCVIELNKIIGNSGLHIL